jgi:dTMP kinase
MKLDRAFLFAFEGIDKAGKKTQLVKARDWFEKTYNLPTRHFIEPSHDSPIGKEIRSYLEHNNELAAPSPLDFQRLYVLDRATDVICYARHSNKKISSFFERYAHSTIAYGMATGISMAKIIQLHQEILGSFMVWPDLTIIIDITADESIRRLQKNSEKPQLFEKIELLAKIRVAYLKIAETEGIGEIIIIDGHKSPEEVFIEVRTTIANFISKSIPCSQ